MDTVVLLVCVLTVITYFMLLTLTIILCACVYNTSGQFLGYIGNSDGSSFDFPSFIVSDKGKTIH